MQGIITKSKLDLDMKYKAYSDWWDPEVFYGVPGWRMKARLMNWEEIRQWKKEMNNTARMGLWFKFRYEAAKYQPKSDDAKKYRAYKRMEKEQREKYIERKFHTDDEFTLQGLYKDGDRDPLPRLGMFTLECAIPRINGKYLEWVGEEYNNRPVYHCALRDSYFYFSRKGTWVVSTIDPREESEKDIWLLNKKVKGFEGENWRSRFTLVQRGFVTLKEEKMWTVGERALENRTDSEKQEMLEEGVDVTFIKTHDDDSSQDKNTIDSSLKRLRDIKRRDRKLIQMSYTEARNSGWGTVNWWSPVYKQKSGKLLDENQTKSPQQYKDIVEVVDLKHDERRANEESRRDFRHNIHRGSKFNSVLGRLDSQVQQFT